jgi:hypothetical protein
MAIPSRPTAETQVWSGQPTQPPFETTWLRVGRRGLNLQDALDTLTPEELAIQVNLVSRYGGNLEVRPGQTGVGTTAGVEKVHSLFRLNDPAASAYVRLAGSATSLYRGTTGAFGASLDTGYSGDPLTFTGVSMPLAGTPYVFISDRSRMRKVARTGAVSVIGLPAATLTSTALAAQASKYIATFDAADPNGSSAAAAWTKTAGQDRSTPPVVTGVPTVADSVSPPGFGEIEIVTVPGGAVTGYDSIVSISRTLNLNEFSPGVPATDDDQMHLWVNVSHPSRLEEVKIYFVTSTPFVAGAIPGAGTDNPEAWYKSIRANDLTSFHERAESTIDAQEALRRAQLIQEYLNSISLQNPNPDPPVFGDLDGTRSTEPTLVAGRFAWTEFGVRGRPLRRGDFARIGQKSLVADTSWGTVTGIVVVIQTSSNLPIQVTLADWSIDGGSGPDVADADRQAYDYRVIHYDPATGAKGNPSAIQAEAAWLHPVRQSVTITPVASGTATIRQRAYRRGGGAATTLDWYFVGVNASDGGAITDILSDDAVLAEETLEIDNDQPVTSVNSAGATVLNQTVPIFFRVDDYTFALGDSLQPGRLYRSKKGKPESWPAVEYQDVCAATEELMNGGQYASAGFVFSRTRLYAILQNGDGSWDTDPSACAEGLASRWAMAVTPYGIAFVSLFGVRLTQGGAATSLSDDTIGKLFRGESANGFAPIDFAVPTALSLTYHDDELWLNYQDSNGSPRHLIYNFKDQAWRSYTFNEAVVSAYSESPLSGPSTLLLGGHATGQLYTHSGFTDDGAAIAYTLRTGALDFGEPRNEKRLSEILVDGDLKGGALTAQAFLNYEVTSVTAQAVTGVDGYRRYVYEPFGTTPMRARTVSVELRGDAATGARPYFNQLGVSRRIEPEITNTQPTPWEELPGGEGYVWGLLITCDTGGLDRTVLVEYTTVNGSITTAATLTVNADGRKKLPFSWTAVLAQQIRLRPTGACDQWIRYKIEWLSDPEPPRVYGWNTNWESFGSFNDKWIKGYMLEADTFNVAKTVVLDVDQVLALNSQSLIFNGRNVLHVSFAKIRGRLFRLRATDTTTLGKFYRWQPIFDEEPLALTRWESQEITHGVQGWSKPLEAWVTLRSTDTVTLTVTAYGTTGAVLNTSPYTIGSTGGVKVRQNVPFNATKGVLFTYVFTCISSFWLYREESAVLVEGWASGQAQWVPVFGNDDRDVPPRAMGNSALSAATPNQVGVN